MSGWDAAHSTTRQYYYAGDQRIAMRENGALTYLLTDHLGSTVVTANDDGAKHAELRYYAVSRSEATCTCGDKCRWEWTRPGARTATPGATPPPSAALQARSRMLQLAQHPPAGTSVERKACTFATRATMIVIIPFPADISWPVRLGRGIIGPG